MTDTTVLSASELEESLTLLALNDQYKVSIRVLKEQLPDIETALFFAKLFELTAESLGVLIATLFQSPLTEALFQNGGTHSTSLQSYIIDDVVPELNVSPAGLHFTDEIPAPSEVLHALWKQEVTGIAASVKEVAATLASTLERMPTIYGQMTFQHMRSFNAQRQTLGRFQAQVQHAPSKDRLVVMDVSGSMSQSTVEQIVDEVVGLAYAVNASLAIVSTTASWWPPGGFTRARVLAAAEYGGTHYETLLPLLAKPWESVFTVADYDSSMAAKSYLADHANTSIGTVYDYSLVGRPTFLAECLGQFASEVKPLAIAASSMRF